MQRNGKMRHASNGWKRNTNARPLLHRPVMPSMTDHSCPVPRSVSVCLFARVWIAGKTWKQTQTNVFGTIEKTKKRKNEKWQSLSYQLTSNENKDRVVLVYGDRIQVRTKVKNYYAQKTNKQKAVFKFVSLSATDLEMSSLIKIQIDEKYAQLKSLDKSKPKERVYTRIFNKALVRDETNIMMQARATECKEKKKKTPVE